MSELKLPHELVIGEMGRIASQMDDLMKFYQTPSQQLSDSLQRLTTQMQDLMLFTSPVQKIMDSMVSTLPQLDSSVYAGISSSALNQLIAAMPQIDTLVYGNIRDNWVSPKLIDQLGTSIFSDTFKDLIPKIDFSALEVFQSPTLNVKNIVDGLTKTATLYSSDAFQSIQAALGLPTNIDESIENLLASFTANDGGELKDFLGETEEVGATLDVISGVLPFDELPSSLKSQVRDTGELIYRTGIAATIIMIWVINILWLYRDKDFEPASGFVETLLTLLLVLREMRKKD